jgi:hypothetical protein
MATRPVTFLPSSSPRNSSLPHSGWRLITTAEAAVRRSVASLRQTRQPLEPQDKPQRCHRIVDVATASGLDLLVQFLMRKVKFDTLKYMSR